MLRFEQPGVGGNVTINGRTYMVPPGGSISVQQQNVNGKSSSTVTIDGQTYTAP